MRRIAWLFILPTLAALGWQVYAALREGTVSAYRVVAIAIAVMTLVWSARLGRRGTASPAGRLLFAISTSGLLSLSILELTIEKTRLLALGFLAIVAGFALVATVLLATTRPTTGGESRGGRAMVGIALSLTMVTVLMWGIEATFRAFVPLQFYEIVPDDPSVGGLTIRVDDMAVPNPGFKGQYMHPEFRGSRVEINAFGMRDGLDEATAPADGALSILVVGDSFSFGTGVSLEETYQERLEEKSTAITTKPLRIYGGAVPGYGPSLYRKRMAALAENTQPDVVIVGVFEGNDFQDNLAADEVSPELRNEASANQQERRGSRLSRYFEAVGSVPYWAGSSAAVQKLRLDATLVKLGIVGPGIHNYVFLDTGLEVPIPALAERIRDATVEQLEMIRRDCEAMQAALVVLIIPDAIQADPARYEVFRARHEKGGVTYDRVAFHQSFVDALGTHGMTVVDMLPHLEAEAVAGRPCYHREGHWNAHGHELAAEQLAPVLAKALAKR